MTVFRTTTIAAVCLSLAGCGGASTRSHDVSFLSLALSAATTGDALQGLTQTPNDAVPPRVVTTYTGSTLLVEGAQSGVAFHALGKATVTFDFLNNGVAGRVDTFYEVSQDLLDGLDADNPATALGTAFPDVVEGALTFDSVAFSFTGQLTKPNGEVARYDLSTNEFVNLGPNYEGVRVTSTGLSQAAGRADRQVIAVSQAIRE